VPEVASAAQIQLEMALEGVEGLATCHEHWMVLGESVAEVLLALMQAVVMPQSVAALAEMRCKKAATSAQHWKREASAGCQDSP